MEYLRIENDFPRISHSAVTLGKFDGIHRGHQKLVEKIIEQKRQAEQHDPVFGDQEGALIRYHGANHTEGRQHQQENQIIEIGVVYKQAGK